MTTEQKIVYLHTYYKGSFVYAAHVHTHKYTHKWSTWTIDPRATDGTAVKELLVRSLQAIKRKHRCGLVNTVAHYDKCYKLTAG